VCCSTAGRLATRCAVVLLEGVVHGDVRVQVEQRVHVMSAGAFDVVGADVVGQ